MKVLIVDDSKAMRMIVGRTLAQTDLGKCTVIEATNGVEALEKVASERPQMVLSDWNMPEMSGIQFLQALRESGSRVIFGFITSETGQEIRDLAIQSGAQFIIRKPFTAQTLNTEIMPCLAH